MLILKIGAAKPQDQFTFGAEVNLRGEDDADTVKVQSPQKAAADERQLPFDMGPG